MNRQAKIFFMNNFNSWKKIVLENYRNSRPEVSEKGTLKNLATAGLWLRPEACKFIKKRLQQRCFPVSFAKFLRTPFL